MKTCLCGTVMKKGIHCEQSGMKKYYICPKCQNRIYTYQLHNKNKIQIAKGI